MRKRAPCHFWPSLHPHNFFGSKKDKEVETEASGAAAAEEEEGDEEEKEESGLCHSVLHQRGVQGAKLIFKTKRT